MSNSNENDRIIADAVKKYALDNNLSLKDMNNLLILTPNLKDKLCAMSQAEIEQIKSLAGAETVAKIRSTLDEVK